MLWISGTYPSSAFCWSITKHLVAVCWSVFSYTQNFLSFRVVSCQAAYPLVCITIQVLWIVWSHTSAKKYSVRVEWLRQSGRAPSEPSETPRWRITPRPASIQRVALYIALRSLFHSLFASCRSPILNDHSGVVANCDNTSEWVHWVCACIGIAMQWVTLRISLLAFLLRARKMQFSLLIIHIIPSRQIYVAIDNPSLVPSVSCHTSSSLLWNYVRAADNISHAENLQSNGCRCFSHMYKFRDRIQVTRVFRYCGERQG